MAVHRQFEFLKFHIILRRLTVIIVRFLFNVRNFENFAKIGMRLREATSHDQGGDYDFKERRL